MKKCEKCKAVYEGHGGLRCGLDSLLIKNKNKCIFKTWLNKQNYRANKVGYELKAIKKYKGEKEK